MPRLRLCSSRYQVQFALRVGEMGRSFVGKGVREKVLLSQTSEIDADSLMRALLVPSPVGGVYARTGLFEQVIEGLSFFISRHRDPETEVFRFPPVMSCPELERCGFLATFPHLLGGVSCLKGSEA